MVQSGKNKCCLAIYFVIEFVQYIQLSCSDYTECVHYTHATGCNSTKCTYTFAIWVYLDGSEYQPAYNVYINSIVTTLLSTQSYSKMS